MFFFIFYVLEALYTLLSMISRKQVQLDKALSYIDHFKKI
jgi:hypothetical protein